MKTKEWIVSPEKLRENSRKAIERDRAQEAETRRRRIETAQTIAITILLIAIIGLLLRSINRMNKEFMKNCTEAGNSVKFCQRAIDGQ